MYESYHSLGIATRMFNYSVTCCMHILVTSLPGFNLVHVLILMSRHFLCRCLVLLLELIFQPCLQGNMYLLLTHACLLVLILDAVQLPWRSCGFCALAWPATSEYLATRRLKVVLPIVHGSLPLFFGLVLLHQRAGTCRHLSFARVIPLSGSLHTGSSCKADFCRGQ